MRKTFNVLLEGPANAVTTNKDSNLVAVAGRNVFKIFAIDIPSRSFIERVNLKSGKNRLTYSSNDVAWNPVDEGILATGATNGHVVIWDLNRPHHPKTSLVFRDHERTINTVCFHPSDVNLLISGSQDGTMKLFDLRKPEAVNTFNSSSESVRDLQFSPHSRGQGCFQICSVLENGCVQIWDSNKLTSPFTQFTAHNGPILSVDWHPVIAKCLATGGRDKTIKIWDMDHHQQQQSHQFVPQSGTAISAGTTGSSSSTHHLQYCIQTIASVARVRWRPSHKFEIASSSLVVDFTVSVWDIRRPFIPAACFSEHRDITRGFVWIDDETLLSAGKDNTLCHHSFDEANKPMASANPVAVDISNPGDMVCAFREDVVISNERSVAAAAVTVHPVVDKSTRSTRTRASNKSSFLPQQQQQAAIGVTQSGIMSANPATVAVVSSRHASSQFFYHNQYLGTGSNSNTAASSSTASSLPSAPSPIFSPPPPPIQHQHQQSLSSFNDTIHGSSTSGASVTGFSQSSAGATTGSNIINTLIQNKNRLTNLFTNKSHSCHQVMKQQGGHRHQNHNQHLILDASCDDVARECSSSVMFMTNISPLSMDWFIESARSYQLTGKSFDDLCHINADVAARLGRIAVSNAWRIVRERYSPCPRRVSTSIVAGGDLMDTSPDVHDEVDGNMMQDSAGDTLRQEEQLHHHFLTSNMIGPLRHVNGNHFDILHRVLSHERSPCSSSVGSSSTTAATGSGSRLITTGMMSDFYDQSDSDDSYVNIHPVDDFHHHHQQQQELQLQQQESYSGSKNGHDEANISASYFFADVNDWSTCFTDSLTDVSAFFQTRETLSTSPSETLVTEIPEEAFIQRHDIADYPIPPTMGSGNSLLFSTSPAQNIGNGETRTAPDDPALHSADASKDNGTAPASTSSSYVIEMLLSRHYPISKYRSRIQSDASLIESILRAFAAEGDVQSCVSLLIVLGDRMRDVNIDEITQEKWFTAYIELLYRFQLWSVATQVISLSQIPNVNTLNQTSTNVNLCCGNCGKLNHGSGPFVCKNCNTQTCICCVCNQIVYGLYAWCEGCSHGGHLLHLKEWYDANSSCPTGCGHECEYAPAAAAAVATAAIR